MMLILLSTSIIKFLASPWIILTLDPLYLLFSGFIRSLSYSSSVIFPEKFNNSSVNAPSPGPISNISILLQKSAS